MDTASLRLKAASSHRMVPVASLTANPITLFLACSIQPHWPSGVLWMPQGCLNLRAFSLAVCSAWNTLYHAPCLQPPDLTALMGCSKCITSPYMVGTTTTPCLGTTEFFLKPQRVQVQSNLVHREINGPGAFLPKGIWWINAQPPIIWLDFPWVLREALKNYALVTHNSKQPWTHPLFEFLECLFLLPTPSLLLPGIIFPIPNLKAVFFSDIGRRKS